MWSLVPFSSVRGPAAVLALWLVAPLVSGQSAVAASSRQSATRMPLPRGQRPSQTGDGSSTSCRFILHREPRPVRHESEVPSQERRQGPLVYERRDRLRCDAPSSQQPTGTRSSLSSCAWADACAQ